MRDTTPAPAHVVDSLQSRLGRNHLLRLLTAFMLALLTWGWVIQATDPIITTSYTEMEIRQPDLGSDLVNITSLPRAAVRVEGPQSDVSRINRAVLNVRLDTSSVVEAGDYRLPVIVDAPETSARITVEPKTVHVQIDEIVSRVIPLEIQETSTDTGSRSISNVTTDVSQVTISGPSSALDRVAKAVLPVNLDTQTSSFTSYYTPYAIDDNGQRVSEVVVLPSQIMTRVELQSRGRLVTVIPDIIGQPASGYAVQQRNVIPISILVDGPDTVLKDLLFVNTDPVDISGASQSVSAKVGLVGLPEGVSVVEPSSGKVEVRIAIQDTTTTTQTLADVPVNALNVTPGMVAIFDPDTVDVTIEGPAAILTSMVSEDVTVIVDVRGMAPGTYTLRPTVALRDTGVIVQGIIPETVTVTIQLAPATPESRHSSTNVPVALSPAGTDSPRSRTQRQ